MNRKAQELRAKERKALLERLRLGEATPQEKVDLYIRGQFFFPDVFEIRAPREVVEKDPKIKAECLVELDGRLWYVDPDFRASRDRIRKREQTIAGRIADAARR